MAIFEQVVLQDQLLERKKKELSRINQAREEAGAPYLSYSKTYQDIKTVRDVDKFNREVEQYNIQAERTYQQEKENTISNLPLADRYEAGDPNVEYIDLDRKRIFYVDTGLRHKGEPVYNVRTVGLMIGKPRIETVDAGFMGRQDDRITGKIIEGDKIYTYETYYKEKTGDKKLRKVYLDETYTPSGKEYKPTIEEYNTWARRSNAYSGFVNTSNPPDPKYYINLKPEYYGRYPELARNIQTIKKAETGIDKITQQQGYLPKNIQDIKDPIKKYNEAVKWQSQRQANLMSYQNAVLRREYKSDWEKRATEELQLYTDRKSKNIPDYLSFGDKGKKLTSNINDFTAISSNGKTVGYVGNPDIFQQSVYFSSSQYPKTQSLVSNWRLENEKNTQQQPKKINKLIQFFSTQKNKLMSSEKYKSFKTGFDFVFYPSTATGQMLSGFRKSVIAPVTSKLKEFSKEGLSTQFSNTYKQKNLLVRASSSIKTIPYTTTYVGTYTTEAALDFTEFSLKHPVIASIGGKVFGSVNKQTNFLPKMIRYPAKAGINLGVAGIASTSAPAGEKFGTFVGTSFLLSPMLKTNYNVVAESRLNKMMKQDYNIVVKPKYTLSRQFAELKSPLVVNNQPTYRSVVNTKYIIDRPKFSFATIKTDNPKVKLSGFYDSSGTQYTKASLGKGLVYTSVSSGGKTTTKLYRFNKLINTMVADNPPKQIRFTESKKLIKEKVLDISQAGEYAFRKEVNKGLQISKAVGMKNKVFGESSIINVEVLNAKTRLPKTNIFEIRQDGKIISKAIELNKIKYEFSSYIAQQKPYTINRYKVDKNIVATEIYREPLTDIKLDYRVNQKIIISSKALKSQTAIKPLSKISSKTSDFSYLGKRIERSNKISIAKGHLKTLGERTSTIRKKIINIKSRMPKPVLSSSKVATIKIQTNVGQKPQILEEINYYGTTLSQKRNTPLIPKFNLNLEQPATSVVISPRVKPIIRNIPKTEIKPISKQAPIIKNLIKPITQTEPMLKIKPKVENKQVLQPKSKLELKTLTKTKPIIPAPTFNPTIKIDKPNVPPTPNIFSLNIKRFSFKTDDSRKRKSNLFQQKSYTPTGFAASFGIRGKPTKTGTISGLGLRPIISKSRGRFF